jgi:hypothetical protein
MRYQVHSFDPSKVRCSVFRSLRYPDRTGTTTANIKRYRGRFVKLVPGEKVIEVDEFETTNLTLRGEMTITITLADAAHGRKVLAVHDGLPTGDVAIRQRSRLADGARQTRGARRGMTVQFDNPLDGKMDDVLVFTSQKREQIREELVATAQADPHIGGAAHLGSAALGLLDRWSDIDLALCLAPDADLNQILVDWTTVLYRDHGAVANYDVRRGHILYRVFLLENTVQVDLSFWPATELRPIGPKFKLIFGTLAESKPELIPDSEDLIGMAWLYALHVRSSIARSRLLQAEYMLSGMRDNVLALLCKRYGVTSVQGRGLDDLPEQQRARAAESLVRSLEPNELQRAFRLTVNTLIEELKFAEHELAPKLEGPLNRIVNCLAID